MKFQLTKVDEARQTKTTVLCQEVKSGAYEGWWEIARVKRVNERLFPQYVKKFRTKKQAIKAWKEICGHVIWED